jgi:hypothetical protein
MDEFNVNPEPATAIRPATLTKLLAVATVRDMDPLDVLDEAIEAARAKLAPKPKQASTGGRGKRAAAAS